ncbi:MAG: SdrD B-like domain-containing protein [Anaerolineae bacterium]
MSRFRTTSVSSRVQPALLVVAVLLLSTVAALFFDTAITAEPNIQTLPTVSQVTVASGTTYLDLNRNQVYDLAEGPLQGVQVTVRVPGGTLMTPLTTNVDGYYEQRVPDIWATAGDYVITVVVPQGYFATTPTVVTRTLSAGGRTEVDFGLRPNYLVRLPLMWRNWSRP